MNTSLKKRRPRRTEQSWKSLVEDWQSSGMSATAYAAKHDVNMKSLWSWRRRFEHREQSRDAAVMKAVTPPKMLRVHVVADKKEMSTEAQGCIEVRCPSGHVLQLRGMVPSAQLELVFQTLAQVQSC